MEDFGHKLKVLRTQLKITSTTVSKDLGISQAYVSKIEQSQGNIIVKYLLYLRKNDIDLNSLFDNLNK